MRCAFRAPLNSTPRATLLNSRSISKWLQIYSLYGNVILKNLSTHVPTVETSENVDRVRVFVKERSERSTISRYQILEISHTRL